MVEQDFVNAFNDCVDLLGRGQTIEACLRRYPHYAALLLPMLETGQLIYSLRVSSLEAAEAQARARTRFDHAIRMTTPRRRPSPLFRLATLAAVLFLIFGAVGGGAAIMAQSSLPGDPLYSVKRFTEQLRLYFDTTLAAQFNQQRIDEIHQLVQTGRVGDVIFQGEIRAINGTNWTIAGLNVQVSPDTPGAALAHPGDTVTVYATTTTGGQIVATAITVLVTPVTTTPAVTLVPTLVPVTTRPTPSATTTETRTVTPTPIATASPTLTVTSSPTACLPTAPSGWELYRIQQGDTLSHLALNRNVTLEQVLMVNCLTQSDVIVIGEYLYLPTTGQTMQTIPVGGSIATLSPISGEDSGTTIQPSPAPTSDSHNGSDDGGGDNHSGDNSGSGSDGGSS
jgi:LysM repeat protein